MKIHCLQHVGFEGPGYIEQWAQERGAEFIQTPVYLEEPMPYVVSFDMLVVMGGPMSVRDVRHHPWLTEEKEYLLNALNAGIPTLGICLGAQLIADVLGARVYRNREKEIGWFDVKLHPNALLDPLFRGFPAVFTPYHWHGETFELPVGARPLGSSIGTRQQGFYLEDEGRKAIALQFHLESTAHSIHEICTNAAGELQEMGPYIQTAEQMQSRPDLIAEANLLMKNLLNNMVQVWNNPD